MGCDKVAAQLLLALPGALAGAVYAGNQMNHIALSPKYAGTMYGITNAAANMCGFLAPYVIGLIIEGRVSKLNYENLLFRKISFGYLECTQIRGVFDSIFLYGLLVVHQKWSPFLSPKNVCLTKQP